jgi:hypothetical protein
VLLLVFLALPLAACGETGTPDPGASPTPPPEAAEPGATESDVTLCEALGDTPDPRPSVGVAVTPAGSVPCDEVAACLADAAAAARDDPSTAAVRIDECLGAIPDTSAVSALVGMPGVGALGAVTGTPVWSLSVACQSPALDARLAEGDAGVDTSGLDEAFALYAEASATDDPAVQDEKIKAANAVIAGFEQAVVADTSDLGGGSDDGGPSLDDAGFEWSDDTTWAEDAAAAGAEVDELIERREPDSATNGNAAVFSTIGTLFRALHEGERTAQDTDDPCAEMAHQFAECNAKEWRTDQCQQLRNSFINPHCDATAALTAEGTPCAVPGDPDPQALLAAAVDECHKLVRGTEGTDPCQPPAFDEWQGGGTPNLCSDPAALTREDQCLPGWFPPEDLDRVVHAQQVAVLAAITRKYGGHSVVVVPPSGPGPGYDPGPK